MSSVNTLVFYIEPETIQATPVDVVKSFEKSLDNPATLTWFLSCLRKEGAYQPELLRAIVVELAKSKTVDDHSKVAKRIQKYISKTSLKDFDVTGLMNEVWDQQQAAYEALTPEELAAYNALSPEELLKHSF
jgi:hypothetical protein